MTETPQVDPRVSPTRARTRARLQDAAFTVFAARGFGSASIEEVCEAAGFTRGAFYSNFASLDELFLALHAQRTALVLEQVAQGLAGVDPTAALSVLARGVADVLVVDRDWVLVRTEFLLHAARHPELARALAAQRTRQRAALATLLTPWTARAHLPVALREPDELARAVVAVHDGLLADLLTDLDPDAVRVRLTDVILALLHDPTGTVSRPPPR